MSSSSSSSIAPSGGPIAPSGGPASLYVRTLLTGVVVPHGRGASRTMVPDVVRGRGAWSWCVVVFLPPFPLSEEDAHCTE